MGVWLGGIPLTIRAVIRNACFRNFQTQMRLRLQIVDKTIRKPSSRRDIAPYLGHGPDEMSRLVEVSGVHVVTMQ